MVDVALLHMEPEGAQLPEPASGKMYSFGSNYTSKFYFSTSNNSR